jgi:hypothetical protein
MDRMEMPDAADDAYRRSLLSQRLTVFGEPWPRRVTVADEQLGEEVGDLDDLNRVLAWWAFDEPIDPAILDDPTARALAHAILDEREEAEGWVATALEQRPEDPVAWQVATVLYGHWGDAEAARHYQRVGEVVSGRPYPDREAVPEVPALTNDLATFRAYPRDEMIGAAARLLIRPPMPWVLEQTLP